ncbi:ATP-binding protein [Nitrospira calida]
MKDTALEAQVGGPPAMPVEERRPQYDPKSLLNSQPVIITVIDPVTYRVQFQNETGLRKFGDISGEPCHEKIANCVAPCTFCRMPETVRTGESTCNEVPLPNNQYLLVQWSKVMTVDGQTHVVETITDITERKRVEQALQQAQKMEAIGRLAGGIAHDFNNLLTIINGYSQLLSDELAHHPCRKDLDMIRQAGSRAAALTKKLLAFSRHQVLGQKPLAINCLIRDMEEILRCLIGEQIKIVTLLNPEVGEVLADPVQLEQVVLNLIINARDAMPEGGIVTIETCNVQLDDEYVRRHPGAKPGRYVAMSVRDTGCGMDAATQARLFEPFFSTKEMGKGTGLGLATVYGIVKQSGGYIEVSSEKGRGSVFKVLLPRVEIEVRGVQALAVSERSVEDRKTVLVVEDESGVRSFIATILRAQGYRVLEVSDGVEALKVMQTQANECRLVVTDVIMPRMNGPALARHLAAFIPDLKVLFISGYTGDTVLANGVSEQSEFLPKPILPHVLADKIQKIFCN